MQYRGTVLLLDNFRQVLSGYSVDIQDIVRSAILDGIDLSDCIDDYRTDPYKLDQVRLLRKEGLEEVYCSLSGENIFRIRNMIREGKDISGVSTQLKAYSRGALSEEYLSRTLSWSEAGYNLRDFKIAQVPRNLLDVFEYGFKNGVDMRLFNNGRNYDPEYIKSCILIKGNGFDIGYFVSTDWPLDSLKKLANFSRVKNKAVWKKVLDSVPAKMVASTTPERIGLLIELAKSGISLTKVQGVSAGRYVYDEACLSLVLGAFKKGLDYNALISKATTSADMQVLLNSMEMQKNKKVGGRL